MNIKIGFIIESDNVFNISIEAYNNGEFLKTKYLDLFAARLKSYNYDFALLCVEIHCNTANRLVVVFEEHQTYRTKEIDLWDYNSNENLCMTFMEVPNSFDSPTYAGGYQYLHPLFKKIDGNYEEMSVTEYFDC